MAWNLLICIFCAGAAATLLIGFLIDWIKRIRQRRSNRAAPRVPHSAPARIFSPATPPRQPSHPASPSQSVRTVPARQPVSRASLPPELRFPVCPVLGCRNTRENRHVIRKSGEGEYFCTRCQYRFHPHVKIH